MDYQISKFGSFFKSIIQHYNHKRYWHMRSILVNSDKGTKLGDALRMLYIKRADAYNNASMGTHRGFGARFAEAPNLPHGLNGIIVTHNAVIGKNCTIFHQVTIGENKYGAPVIGDNVVLGAGANVIGNCRVGNNVSIAGGVTVMMDIPDDSVVLPAKIEVKARRAKDGAR